MDGDRPAKQGVIQTATPRTFGAGYIAPHPSIRKDAVDVDGFLRDHEVYTREYLESVQPMHHAPSKWYEFAGWYWHVGARSMVNLFTGASTDSLTEASLAARILFFASVGLASELAVAVYNHGKAVLLNRPDNGWVHTALASAECVRMHGGIMSMHLRPWLPARLFALFIQVALFFQILLVYTLFPSVAHAYEAYRAEEQVFNYSQALRLIERGRFKEWKGARAPALAVSYYGLPEGATMHDALLRMRADEACNSHLNSVLADIPPCSRNPFITMERRKAA